MSTLIRRYRIEPNDLVALEDSEPLPAAGAVSVSLARWQAEAEALRASGLDVAVRIPNTADVLAVWPGIADRRCLLLEFPAFGDGRAYSQASLLRERCDYRGELRATGQAVVRDQLHGMMRVGFDAFALRQDQDPQACLAAFDDFRIAYQPAADHVLPVWKRRQLPAN